MSAFVCQPETYSRIYSGLRVFGTSKLWQYDAIARATSSMMTDTLEHLVFRLYSLNVQAVNQRYDEKSPDWMGDNAFATYRQFNPHVSIFQFLKDLECLHYQLCEGDIPQTKEYQQLDELINAVYRVIVHEDPNYKAAGWD